MHIEIKCQSFMTMAVFCYNHEAYIEEALRGALSQDYFALEIMVFDDCSTDGSVDIIRRVLSGYDGPHTVSLYISAKNHGLAYHIVEAAKLAKGELLFGAAGDDVSLSSRVSRVVQYWQREARKARMIYTDVMRIDKLGNFTGIVSSPVPAGITDYEAARLRFSFVQGAAQVWSPSLLLEPFPLPCGLVNEDRALSFRAWMSGGVLHVPEALVKYRMHENNISRYSWLSVRECKSSNIRRARLETEYLEFFLRELDCLPKSPRYQTMRSYIYAQVQYSRFREQVYECNFSVRIRSILQLFNYFRGWDDRLYCLAPMLYCRLFVTVRKIVFRRRRTTI